MAHHAIHGTHITSSWPILFLCSKEGTFSHLATDQLVQDHIDYKPGRSFVLKCPGQSHQIPVVR